jgi:hypothetical protein
MKSNIAAAVDVKIFYAFLRALRFIDQHVFIFTAFAQGINRVVLNKQQVINRRQTIRACIPASAKREAALISAFFFSKPSW